jgi:hypothetical protein
MSPAPQTPPVTPVRPGMMAAQNGAANLNHAIKENSSQKDAQESIKRSESLAIRELQDKIEVPSTKPPQVIKDQPSNQSQNSDQDMPDAETNASSNNGAPASPHSLEPFDWDNFQARYDHAMAEANATEQALLNEFNELANASYLSIFQSFRC